MRGIVKAIVVLPVVCLCWLYRAGLFEFSTGSCLLAVVPGILGAWLRRQWYQRTLRRCGQYLNSGWMSVIHWPGTCLGDGVTIGYFCVIVEADIGNNVLLGSHVSIVRGMRQHGIERLDIPIVAQAGQVRPPKIGNDVWVGTSATIMADVAPGSVVGAGAVVTKTFEPYSILVGTPARVIRMRGDMRMPQPLDSAVA